MENYKEEEILDYKIIYNENVNIDYRNSNYKILKIYFEELNRYIYLKQDFKLGKGGILWDGVNLIFYKIVFYSSKNIL